MLVPQLWEVQDRDAKNNTTAKTEDRVLEGSSTAKNMDVSWLRSPWEFPEEQKVVDADELTDKRNSTASRLYNCLHRLDIRC